MNAQITDLARFTRNHAAEAGAQRAAEQYAALLETAEALRAENARLREVEDAAEEVLRGFWTASTIQTLTPQAKTRWERLRAALAGSKQ